MEEFRNRVFNEDVLNVLKRIPDNSLDMVYGDPDYNVGINYSGKKQAIIFSLIWPSGIQLK